MIKIIVITGMGGVGKSTFVTHCIQYCKESHPDIVVKELSTVDFVKQIAAQCGWTGTKRNKDRVFLSDLKIAMAKWDDIPIKHVFNSITKELNETPDCSHIFFINSREPEDVKYIYKMAAINRYPIMTLRIQNPNAENNEVAELIDGINSISCDKTIVNDHGLDELSFLAGSFVEEILKKCK